MATTTPSMSAHKRPTFSCIRCAERKVKCDRQRPCAGCVKGNVECIFNPVQPPKQRNKRVKVKVLTDRLKQYEALLQEKGIDPGNLPNQTDSRPKSQPLMHGVPDQQEQHVIQLQTPSSLESGSSPYGLQTSTVRGQAPFRFVENSLWNRVVEESLDPDNDLEDSSDISEEESTTGNSGFAVIRSSHRSGKPRHPPLERLIQLWEIFVSNVDPLTKVVHVPSLRPMIEKAAKSLGLIPRPLEALMFAIYGSAIMSLSQEECEQRFAKSRDQLLSQYISGTEAALSRARVMETSNLVVLQALVIHLITIREIYAPRTTWTLTGVAVRIAQSMGLERDGKYLGISPFETEIRRRIWFQLKAHDSRAAELCGLAKYRDPDIGPERADWPTNVNDDQLHPGMSELPSDSNGLTDVIFIVTRCEMGKFAAPRIAALRQEGMDPSQMNLDHSAKSKNARESLIQELEDTIETKHLRYCDPSQPLHLVAMVVARYGLNVARFLIHHPRNWGTFEKTPLEERKKIWEVCLKLLEQQIMLQTNPVIKRFAWSASYFRQWHALIHLLDTLRAHPNLIDTDRAWRLIGETYDNNPEMLEDMRRPIHAAVGNLCLKAYDDHEALMRSKDGRSHSPPGFIARLRHQRDSARLRRQKRTANGGHAAASTDQTRADIYRIDGEALADNSNALMESTQASFQASFGPTQDTVFDSTHSFTFSNHADGTFFDSMDLDGAHDFLATDYIMDDSSLEFIDWGKLDSWLAHAS
ncbi:hypothetical protein J4E86_002005 [Alternaria arbusti]|uniref:uncharacterized protein n=1 Tax=Alternaria arbusti TaxID=232088 RepID=UPI0022205606|nr:uncharacterized protein J4E86_002005 [Alternaria arbusti]KAI4960383.1 hypothetical protein J4E86_002005 [Alternaria arbusti]